MSCTIVYDRGTGRRPATARIRLCHTQPHARTDASHQIYNLIFNNETTVCSWPRRRLGHDATKITQQGR